MSAPTYPAGGPAPSGKTIVLFSDGTGNSSAKLFKTNVWRMYEAVNLGPAAPDRRPQIAYYDDGVGTSGFKPLAVLGGVFGYGLKRNVLDIYKYVCRNYEPGDQIYAFGFSRGAFTTRLVVALIAEEGLVPSKSEGELDRQARCVYRHLRRHLLPRKLQFPTKVRRWIRDRFDRTVYKPDAHERPDIRFVGVWDTVAAYGGPFAEVTRAIDNWIYPLSMPDYKLSTKVQDARHALALDDERDAFHPLLWDEVHEQTLIDARVVDEDRLQQVWFTGMHSDVGGGYPDESLSYVSLLWIMEEAEKERVDQTGVKTAGLRTLEVIKDRFTALASSAGPIHDSRKGVAAYYRYQPRKIAAWIDPCDVATAGLRDPAITQDDKRTPKGLLRSVKVHESVISRISCGTDRYAPITLPETFEIFPPQAKGENVPQADSVSAATGTGPQSGSIAVASRPQPLVSEALRQQLTRPDVQKARASAFEAVWDNVWRRRVAYFLTLGVTLLLATMPAWVDHAPESPFLADGRTWIDAPLRAAGLLLPGFLASWIDTFADAPLYSLALLGLIWIGMRFGKRYERRLRDLARGKWEAAVDQEPPAEMPEVSALTRFRTSSGYQTTMQRFKWGLLPFGILGVMVVVAAWLGAAGLTQLTLPWLEGGTALCESRGPALAALTDYSGVFEPKDLCHEVGATVEKDRRYRVEFRVEKPWFDGSHATNPQGLRARDIGLAGIVGGPFRRVIEANFLQPIVEVREPSRHWRDNVYMTPLALTEQEPGVFSAVLMATRDGELFVFANDAISLLNPRYFYEKATRGHNYGRAALSIRRLEDAPIAGLPSPERQASTGR